jgi:RimJ/RimL family protein N-acetyltransferase
MSNSNTLKLLRLILRPLSADDAEAVAKIAGSTDPSKIPTLVSRSASWWIAHGFGVWVITEPKNENILGWCGLRPEPTPESPELLYGLAESARGKGIATEAASAVVHHVFATLEVDSVWAATEHSNESSIGVMQRIGMQREKRTILDGIDSAIYRICNSGTENRNQ